MRVHFTSLLRHKYFLTWCMHLKFIFELSLSSCTTKFENKIILTKHFILHNSCEFTNRRFFFHFLNKFTQCLSKRDCFYSIVDSTKLNSTSWIFSLIVRPSPTIFLLYCLNFIFIYRNIINEKRYWGERQTIMMSIYKIREE